MHAARQVFEVHLVHDAEAGRHDAEGLEGLHAPLHELVALAVALELELHVQVERIRAAVVVDHDRVIDHQVHRHQRLDRSPGLLPSRAATLRIAARSASKGTPVKSCRIDARHHERDFIGAVGVGIPVGQLAHVLGRHLLAVAVAQHRLQHDAHATPAGARSWELPGQRRQREELARLARGDLESLEGARSKAWGISTSERCWSWLILPPERADVIRRSLAAFARRQCATPLAAGSAPPARRRSP